MELGQSYIPYWPNFRIQWPELEIGQMATESCACGALNSSSYLATRICGGNYSNGAMWEAQDVSQCSFSNSTLELCQASEVQCLYRDGHRTYVWGYDRMSAVEPLIRDRLR